ICVLRGGGEHDHQSGARSVRQDSGVQILRRQGFARRGAARGSGVRQGTVAGRNKSVTPIALSAKYAPNERGRVARRDTIAIEFPGEEKVRGGAGMLALVACVASNSAQAEGLLEVYRLAVRNDPRLAAARFDQEASQKSTRAALAGLLPTVIGSTENTQERQNILSSQNAVIGAGFSKFPITDWTLTITQPLFRLAAWERLRQAEAGEKQTLAQRIAAEQALIVRVAT